MSFIINSLDLSLCVTHFQQVIKPSFSQVLATSNRLATTSDYGYEYDKYFSDIDLALSDYEYAQLKALVGTATTLTSTLDVFIPGTTFANGTPVGIMSIQDVGWLVPELHNINQVQIRIKLLVNNILPIGDVSLVQELIDRGSIERGGDVGLYAPDLVSSGYKSIQNEPLKRFYVSQSLVTPYKASKIVLYYLQVRGARVPLSLSARHGEIGTRDVQLSDIMIQHDGNNKYGIGLTVTIV